MRIAARGNAIHSGFGALEFQFAEGLDVKLFSDASDFVSADVADDVHEHRFALPVDHRDDQALNDVIVLLFDVDVDVVAAVLFTDGDELGPALCLDLPANAFDSMQ